MSLSADGEREIFASTANRARFSPRASSSRRSAIVKADRLLVAGGLAYLIAQGDRSWFVGALLALLVFVGVFFLVIYLAHIRNTVGRFRQMRVPEATLSCTEDHFTVSSELGSATMPWSAITEIWHHPRFWLILFSKSQFSTLPLDCLNDDTRAFIIRKTQHNRPDAKH
jgi:hypothetical protein